MIYFLWYYHKKIYSCRLRIKTNSIYNVGKKSYNFWSTLNMKSTNLEKGEYQ